MQRNNSLNRFLEDAKAELWSKDAAGIFFTAFIGGLICHGYEMFAKHPNYDEFISIFHYGGGYELGRWFLSLLGNLVFRIDGCYSLP